jgi:hypothetical protein
MKPTNLSSQSQLLQPPSSFKPQSNGVPAGLETSPREDVKNKPSLMYDFEQEFSLKELADEPTPAVAWVHLSCAFWLPELDFEEEWQRKPVIGFERLDKKRFRLVCSICQLRGVGCCIQCNKGKCQTSFHVECARLAGLYLEVVECDDSEPVYHAYCERHRPLKLQITLEQSKMHATEEIATFCKLIARSRAPAEKLEQDPDTANTKTKTKTKTKMKMKMKKPPYCKLFTKADQKTLLARIKTVGKKYAALVIFAARTKPSSKPPSPTTLPKPPYRLLPSPRRSTYVDTLRKRQFPWNQVKFGRFTAQDCFQKYLRLVPNEMAFNKMVLGKTGQKLIEASKRAVPLAVAQPVVERKKYCYCRKMSNEVASQMIGTGSDHDL